MPIKTRTKIYNEETTLGGERKEKANAEAALAFLLQETKKTKKRPNDWQVYIKIIQILPEGGMSH